MKQYTDETFVEDFSVFNELEKVIVLVWIATGLIGNGGFERLFDNDPPGIEYGDLLQAYKAIGCSGAVQATERAFAIFPKSDPPRDKKLRMREYMKYPEELRDEIDISFFKETDNITTCLAKFIMANRSLLPTVEPDEEEEH